MRHGPTAALLVLLAGAPAVAKNFQLGPVFDMGVLTNTLSMSDVIQREQRRAAKLREQQRPRAVAQVVLVGAAMAAPPSGPVPSLR